MPSLPPIAADRVQLQQVILNLLVNACDSMIDNAPPDRRVVITTADVGSAVRLSISDRGTGISVDPLELVFEAIRDIEAAWARSRPFDLPVDHRFPRWPTLGRKQRGPRSDVSSPAATYAVRSSTFTARCSERPVRRCGGIDRVTVSAMPAGFDHPPHDEKPPRLSNAEAVSVGAWDASQFPDGPRRLAPTR